MGKKDTVPNRQYTAEFRREAVRLAESLGGHPAAKQLGVPQSTITIWVRRSRAGSLGEAQAPAAVAKRPVSELEAEVSRLRRELASAKLDNEILRKATVYRSGPVHLDRIRTELSGFPAG